jgi:hypothetical protein
MAERGRPTSEDTWTTTGTLDHAGADATRGAFAFDRNIQFRTTGSASRFRRVVEAVPSGEE